ncbi:hypothetical protein HWC92_gp44 [Flavobacterium phage vB_FspS_morran9-1]|uniref:Lin1244/Lin1753-like N-terminal domain-containing protein n=1 Tax=Flavobacterium phage vB_FspS_morran9-1 TaxID=2686258 RepID=A0A6B9LJ51_9CAUD|nr:hypothetical protein HWC92_gp44 [Flavobacterium phage vB_FspS_morran9-1]QHB39578.1 hypothetical protein morran91_gp044 [Flavobacterium phage vB_FspS_morran9-1]
MAKELPYFKFEPNQWENGNIQMLSREDKGLFMDLCSMYWSRLGDVPLKLAVQKLCAGNATALNPLCDEKIIELIEGNIFIKFLSEQLNEFEDTSKQNSKNAKEGWEKRRKLKEESERNATALNPQCENDAIKEEEIKEDKIKQKRVVNKFTPPSQIEVIDYFNQNGYSNESAIKAFNYYETGNWKDGKGNQVKNWKQKMQSVWFKEDNKIKPVNKGYDYNKLRGKLS